MTWTPEQILEALKIVFTFLGTAIITVGGWFFVAKLNKANTEKAKAEAAAIYQDMATQAAERERQLSERLVQFEKDATVREDLLNKRIEELDKALNLVKEALVEKVKENSDLQRQIAELRVQTDEQAQEIIDLREEVNTLRAKRKQQ